MDPTGNTPGVSKPGPRTNFPVTYCNIFCTSKEVFIIRDNHRLLMYMYYIYNTYIYIYIIINKYIYIYKYTYIYIYIIIIYIYNIIYI